ncbi:TetR/AcrR family transcriptional regulator [Sphaerisporangium rhizosphaerae]|uniref:TetR/AcrR family transcriptional regulator n=1 Tax=Sphaerisporangium rhizosphaerae TaxID=2269375 RepID=A0ABW2NWN0_9ACTN
MPSFDAGLAPDRPQAPRLRRADAQRNYERLLATAREVFAERGADAPLDEIARRAGIGNATMYRHFPTRSELLIAVYADEVAALCSQGESLLTDASPGDALFEWLGAFLAHVATKRDLALTIPDDQEGQRSELFDRWHTAMRAIASKLLARAQDAAAARADLDPSDLLTLAAGIAAASTGPEQAERCLEVLRHGISRDGRGRRRGLQGG